MGGMEGTSKINTKMGPKVLLTQYAHDVIHEYELNEGNTPWLFEILKELEEDLSPEESYPLGFFHLSLTLCRKKNPLLGEHLIVKSRIESKYHLPCGLTLAPVPQHMQHSVNAVFIHDSQKKFPEYEEATSIFVDGEEMELYFYHKGEADINEFIHEQVFLEVPPFPRSVTPHES